jgi:hypothetical protein
VNGAIEQYWIPPHVRACSTAASTILLDLKRNRYFGIGADETRALYTLALNWSEANAHALEEVEPLAPETAVPIADALVEAGLLSREAPADAAIANGIIDLGGTLTSVGHELDRAARMHYSHVINFLRAWGWTGRALRSRPLYAIVREVGERKLCAPEYFDEQRAIELVGIFRRLRPHIFSARNQCLFHALALVSFLARYDVYPTWVIGVRLRPWAAHSWVQQGSLLLDSNPEQVCEYMPILAV